MSTPSMKELIEKATPPSDCNTPNAVWCDHNAAKKELAARCNPATMAKVVDRLLLLVNTDNYMEPGFNPEAIAAEALDLLNGKPTQ